MKTPHWARLLMFSVLLGTPASAHAQASGFGFDVMAGYVDLGGDDFDELRGGFATDLIFRYRWTDGFTIGVGAEVGWPPDPDDPIPRSNLVFLSFFAEPRFSFSIDDSPVSPFVGARIGYARLNFDIFDMLDEELFEANSNGLELGAILGVEVGLTEEIGLAVAGELSRIDFGELMTSRSIPDPPGDLGTATKFGIQAGIQLLFL